MSVANTVQSNASGRLMRFLRRASDRSKVWRYGDLFRKRLHIQAVLPMTGEQETATTYAGPRRRTLLKLILIVVGIGVGLALCEISMRAFQLGNTQILSLYNDRIFKLPPHIRFMNYNENKNLIETNNLGFHDRERQAANDNYRILFLGDSFVEGRQVKTESLFTSRLEKKLTSEGQKIEVINGGVPGTGTPYQYVLWKEFFEPNVKIDHVVLCFFMGNDLIDNNLELVSSTSGSSDSGFFVDSSGTILDAVEKPGLLKRAINSGRDHSALINTLYEGAYRIRRNFQQAAEENGTGDAERRGRVDSAGAWEASEHGTIALIRRWKVELAGKNLPFDIVIIDRPGRVYNKFELDFIEKLKATSAQDQIDCLRLKLDGDPYELYSFDGIALGHFNDKGHETVASELYEFFQSHHKATISRPLL
jgi:lysophospholipase L1-like esterase